MYYVYILQSLQDKRMYTGHTENIQRRVIEHKEEKGPGIYTKNRGPWELVYKEEYPTRREAIQREKYLKTGAGNV